LFQELLQENGFNFQGGLQALMVVSRDTRPG